MKKLYSILIATSLIIGIAPLSMAFADGEPKIYLNTSDGKTTDVEINTEIQITKTHYIEWVPLDYQISVCDMSNDCANASKVSIPYAGYLVKKNMVSVNNVQIVRNDLTHFKLYFLKKGIFRIEVTGKFVVAANPYGTLTTENRDCSKNVCMNADASITLGVTSELKTPLPLDNNVTSFPKSEIANDPDMLQNATLRCPTAYSNSKSIECTYQLNLFIDKQYWDKYGMYNEGDSALSGSVNVKFCSRYTKTITHCETDGTSYLENFSKEIVLGAATKIVFKNYVGNKNWCVFGEYATNGCYSTPKPPVKIFSIASIEKSFRSGMKLNCSNLPKRFSTFKFQEKGTTADIYGKLVKIYGLQLLRVTAGDNGINWNFWPYKTADSYILDLWECSYPFKYKK